MARKRPIRSYRDLDVWQCGINLVEQVYRLAKGFPAEEKYVLATQLRRAAISIPSNIAEGWGRDSKKEYVHFVRIARSSLLEVETQLIIAHRLGYLDSEALGAALRKTEVESRMLLSLMRSLRQE